MKANSSLWKTSAATIPSASATAPRSTRRRSSSRCSPSVIRGRSGGSSGSSSSAWARSAFRTRPLNPGPLAEPRPPWGRRAARGRRADGSHRTGHHAEPLTLPGVEGVAEPPVVGGRVDVRIRDLHGLRGRPCGRRRRALGGRRRRAGGRGAALALCDADGLRVARPLALRFARRLRLLLRLLDPLPLRELGGDSGLELPRAPRDGRTRGSRRRSLRRRSPGRPSS